MESNELRCWKCGGALDAVPLPLARRAVCPACDADLHVCRMCAFYDTGVSRACREPVADEVKDKERANFCGYLAPAVRAPEGGSTQADAARAELEAMFGLDGGDAGAAPAGGSAHERQRAAEEAARRQLDRLFGDDERGEDS